ncbi:MAG: transcriptional repressor [Ruminococcaceae bacterium]|nr:transcriptional repressor [Oscillospiraceae bacterium]
MTVKRAAVWQVLRESEGHLQPDEIFRRAKLLYPGMVLATVYNNLHALCEAGLIRRIRTADGADYYDKTPTPHEHAICTDCGKMLDLELGDLSAAFAAKTDMPILSYDLIVHTLCPVCRAKEKEA